MSFHCAHVQLLDEWHYQIFPMVRTVKADLCHFIPVFMTILIISIYTIWDIGNI